MRNPPVAPGDRCIYEIRNTLAGPDSSGPVAPESAQGHPVNYVPNRAREEAAKSFAGDKPRRYIMST